MILILLIILANMNFNEAIKGTKAPDNLIKELRLLDIEYYDFNNKIQKGQIVINKSVEKDLKEIFELMLKKKFPIEKMNPIVVYDWNDDKSMEENNTSAFNYRFIAGTERLSNHSYGKAIDINPRMNPVFYSDGKISPKNGKRDTSINGTFYESHFIVKEFKKRGWRWGGDWTSFKDYHHFDKID